MSSSWGSDGPRGPGDLPPLPPELDPHGRRHARRHRNTHGSGNGKTVAIRSAQVIAAALSVLLLVTFGLYWWRYRTFTSGLKRIEIAAPAAGASGNTNAPTQDIDGKDQNILIVGNDDRTNMTDAEVKALHTGRDGGSLNTDTMMIVHVPADGKQATLISMPRDAYVEIPGHGKAKLNSAYTDGYRAASGGQDAKRAAGANLLIQTVQDLTGLTMDHYVQVDLIGFYRISRAIGGVKVNMCAPAHDSYTGIDLHKGVNTIEGVSALAFVRQRHGLKNGDLDRVKRQQYFLTAAFRKMASAGILLNPIKLQDLLNAVKNSLYLDSTLKPLDLARQLENLTANHITSKTIPFERFADVDVGSVEIVDPAKVQAFVAKLIGPATDSSLAKAKTVSPSSVTVAVLNAGSGINGAAHTSAAALEGAGFTVGKIGDSSTATKTTTIEYADGMQSQAKTLAQYVPGATLRKADVSTLTLLLGADGTHAKSTAAPSSPAGSSAGSSSSSAPSSSTSAGASASSSKGSTAIDAKCIY